ncbi:hypothetical protein DDB_G0271406 [Dictyostelium discoideum AX4]|uniref:Uncharacterized protein n=1 Tax=Dictyostelium discoideum TaxID=44689 RepID=Q55B87_DICDI|nr:hypothetical protein DDB_G0271406 [Dictyostelium discoideum AX4]EAL71833.1 hypothetical protein DDB_G0271406 [Dictyostelium discoideum AX4]|eukprot:XP_645725.1 hypothetical protein DDB_G0271406 [Dictyostelium discoideum AX4]
MSTNKKFKKYNNKIFQDVIDFEILRSIINYLLTSNTNKKNNNNNYNTSNQYKINKFYLNGNEILNYTLVSKKWYNFISLTISNNIINNKLFEHWLKINYNNNNNYNIINNKSFDNWLKIYNNNNNKSFIENYNNRNQYDKNNLFLKSAKQNKISQFKISFNKEFSIIKIKESIINDYFKFNLFLDYITIDDFKEIKKKFENNQLLYNRIVIDINIGNGYDDYSSNQSDIIFKIHEYISNENLETISNLFKILELNYVYLEIGDYIPKSPEKGKSNNKKCTEMYFKSLSVDGLYENEETVKIFKIFKGKNVIFHGPTHADSPLFDPDNSGQQVESFKVQTDLFGSFVEARHLIKSNQFENLHSISIKINSFQILSNISEEMGSYRFYNNHNYKNDPPDSKNMKSELNQMINSFITSKSLKNLKITANNTTHYSIEYDACYIGGDHETFANKINENIESYSNSFKPLFSELNTSIERIELNCCGLLNINTFSNLLNNKSIKYLYLYGDSDFIVYSSKQNGGNSGGGDGVLHKESISINQYLFDNIFTSPLTSIRHYRIKFKESNQLKLIFNLIFNNIFKLQLYSLIFKIYKNELVGEFVKEFKNLINNISTQQDQQQKLNNIYLKEIKIKIEDDKYIQELNNIKNPYFTTVIKKLPKRLCTLKR